MATRQLEATQWSAGGWAQCRVLLRHDWSVARAGIHPRGPDFSQRERLLCSSCDQVPAHLSHPRLNSRSSLCAGQAVLLRDPRVIEPTPGPRLVGLGEVTEKGLNCVLGTDGRS